MITTDSGIMKNDWDGECPNCGKSMDTVVSIKHPSGEGGSYQQKCFLCGLRGPEAGTSDDSFKAMQEYMRKQREKIRLQIIGEEVLYMEMIKSIGKYCMPGSSPGSPLRAPMSPLPGNMSPRGAIAAYSGLPVIYDKIRNVYYVQLTTEQMESFERYVETTNSGQIPMETYSNM